MFPLMHGIPVTLFISDFQDTYEPDNLIMSRVDELYWRMYNFLDETCNGRISDYTVFFPLPFLIFVSSKLALRSEADKSLFVRIINLILRICWGQVVQKVSIVG